MEEQDIYWHELTKGQQSKVIESGVKIDTFKKIFSQPIWCSYTDALQGFMGCWSLMQGKINNIGDCGNCNEKVKDATTINK